jgi:PAS domain S-box-containing protein
VFTNIGQFFDASQFMPHGHCYLWRPDILWLNVISDAFIALSYYVIPGFLVYFVRRRKDLAFNWIFVMFAMFILACGTTHLVEIWTTWHPNYGVQGLVKFFTASVSLATGIALWPLMPRALALPSALDLAESRRQLQLANDELRSLNSSLEARVRQKTTDVVRLASIVQSSNDAIISSDLNGQIISWNRGAEHLLGYNEEEAKNLSRTTIVPPERIQEISDYMDRVNQGQSTEALDTVRITKDGRRVDVILTVSQVIDVDGTVMGHAAILRDNTTRKRMEEELRRSEDQKRAILNASLEAIITIDHRGNIVDCNSMAEKTFEFQKAQVLGREMAELIIPPQLREAHRTGMARFLETGEGPILGKRIELRGMKITGEIIPIELSLAAILRDDQPPLFTASIRDITSRKILEDRVRVSTEAIMQKNQEMEQFVYTVSHDLKSPLVTSVGFLCLLKEDIASRRFDKVPDSLMRLERANTRMSQLIDDLLQLSRAGRLKLEIEPTSMSGLLKSICDNLSAQIREKSVQVIIAENIPDAQVDRKRIYQVFENLIVNALKYGCQDANSTIEIGGSESNLETCYFVRDHGVGIAKEYHQKIFGLFQRLESDNRGTGVGLAIVSRIIQMHGGRVWVESSPGDGATFWLSFPRAAMTQRTNDYELH